MNAHAAAVNRPNSTKAGWPSVRISGFFGRGFAKAARHLRRLFVTSESNYRGNLRLTVAVTGAFTGSEAAA